MDTPGATPSSWDECADWVDGGGVVLNNDQELGWVDAERTSDEWRAYPITPFEMILNHYRLVPPIVAEWCRKAETLDRVQEIMALDARAQIDSVGRIAEVMALYPEAGKP